MISLDGGLEEVEESFLALASSNSNSATRLVNAATKAFNSSICLSLLSMPGQ